MVWRIYVHQIRTEISTLVFAQNAHGQADKCPQMNHLVVSSIMLAQLMDLSVAVMATGDTICCLCCLDLVILHTTVFKTLFFESGLQEPAAAAATEIVGLIGDHIDEIFFAHDGLYDETQIIGNGITI